MISPFRYRAWSELRLAAWSCDCLDALRAVKRSVHRKAARADIVCPVQLVVEDQGLTGADVGGFAAAEAYIRIGHEILL